MPQNSRISQFKPYKVKTLTPGWFQWETKAAANIML